MPLEFLTQWLTSDVFLSALGGGLGGGLITGLLTWCVSSRQTKRLFEHERHEAAREREVEVLRELLERLASVEHGVINPDLDPDSRRDAYQHLHEGLLVLIPRVSTRPVRERYRALVILVEIYLQSGSPLIPDGSGGFRTEEPHPGFNARRAADVGGWSAYVRDTIEARLAGESLPPEVPDQPRLDQVFTHAWDWHEAVARMPTPSTPVRQRLLRALLPR